MRLGRPTRIRRGSPPTSRGRFAPDFGLGASCKIEGSATRRFRLRLSSMPAKHVSVIVQLMLTSHGAFICLACGGELAEPLRRTASLRCHDCRELNAPLRVEHARSERALRLRLSILDRGELEGLPWQPLADVA